EQSSPAQSDDVVAGREPALRRGLRPEVRVTVALSTLLHLDEQPGELAGYGPIPADTARRIAHDPTGTWRRMLVDSAGRLRGLSSTRYRPPRALRDHIEAQYDTCSFVGCRQPGHRTEIDHIVPWPDGPTTVENTHPVCPRHHHLKHETGWTVTRHLDNTVTWTSATGREYSTEPATWPVDLTRDPDRLRELAAPPPEIVSELPDDPPF
ncbi:MAG: HNH endonuclease, partial [Gordonia polyisoprenivorans]|nr:HNH endonuclease [Gordonia polyisoprenivorans]